VLAWEAVFPSIPIAVLITAVLYINEFPDYEADKSVGKLTAVVRLGRKRASKGYIVLMVALYLSILLPILFSLTNWYTILGLATVPIAVMGSTHVLAHYDQSLWLIPACASTVTNHLFTGVFLSLSYLLIGFSAEPLYALVLGSLCLALSLAFYYQSERKAKAAASASVNE